MDGIPKEAALEDLIVERLAAQGWVVEPLSDADGRTDRREVVLRERLATSLRRLNPLLDEFEIQEAVRTVVSAESQSPIQENLRAFRLVAEGVPVESRGSDGLPRTVRAKLIDFEDPSANDFLAVRQLTIRGSRRERRPDVVLFVNGLPLVLIEVKRPGGESSSLKSAFNQVATYVQDIPDIFTWNQMCVITDGLLARAGTFASRWEHFAPWKTVFGTIASDSQPQYEVLVDGMLRPSHFLDLVHNFTAFMQDAGVLTKYVAKYHQFWAVNRAVHATVEAVENDRRAGVVWHTQGSGKSFEMLWYAAKVMRHPAMENPTVIVLTDRNDLDDQLFDDTFSASVLGVPLPESPVQANSRSHLKELLAGREAGGIIFSTIQKFGLSVEERAAGNPFPLLSARMNIVVVVDEAHRSNYDFIDGFARHLRDGLPSATFIGFTGTPIESSDKSTAAVFGPYIDKYDLTQAVKDGATVKVYYEARLARVELPDQAQQDLDSAFATAIAESEELSEERLKSKWARVEAIVGSDRRLDELAEDIVLHWESRRAAMNGKGLIVTMSRRIAAALYERIGRLRPEWVTDDDETGIVKVVITGSAADDPLLQPHIRTKDARRSLKDRARDPNDSLELVIVRDMWLTGFDSPSMHTMYVDKPMRGANLMQAIARVNRTFRDKEGGLVVDYIGVADDLQRALVDYTDRDRSGEEVGSDLRASAIPGMQTELSIVSGLLHGYDWRARARAGDPRAFIDAVAGALDHLLSAQYEAVVGQESLRHRFLNHAGKFVRLYAVCAGSPDAEVVKWEAGFIEAVRAQLSKLDGADRLADPLAEIDTAVRQIVSEAMAGAGVVDLYEMAGLVRPDLSLIDEAFIERFKLSERKNLQLEALRKLLTDEISQIAKRNTVAGKQFSEMLSDSIAKYLNRALDSAQVIQALADLASQMAAESSRGQELGLSSSELALYDAIRGDEVASHELGEGLLLEISRELDSIVRREAKTDWTIKEQLRAKLRASVKRLLRRRGYPHSRIEETTKIVLEQAELFVEPSSAFLGVSEFTDTQPELK